MTLLLRGKPKFLVRGCDRFNYFRWSEQCNKIELRRSSIVVPLLHLGYYVQVYVYGVLILANLKFVN